MDNNEVYVTPLDGARTCVNGSVIREKRRVRHGDRILWGNNHFFRLNCPRLANSPTTSSTEPEQKIDYDFAQQELMENELGDDPIQEAIGAIEKQHEEDKQDKAQSQNKEREEGDLTLLGSPSDQNAGGGARNHDSLSCNQRGDLRLSDPPLRQGGGDRDRTRDRKKGIASDLIAGLLLTVPPKPRYMSVQYLLYEPQLS
ncbi:kinesin-like protein kif13a [Plakobranchus ocellatus]|uniref:Kinesin-like protein kif13a n=1 Tax=Plakobranchus ocellatus TaxID=259542 RepID=A0AAV3Z040_9GAST|nr:kinesin-like protein kif13a [Plakobranchus ocellatus]